MFKKILVSIFSIIIIANTSYADNMIKYPADPFAGETPIWKIYQRSYGSIKRMIGINTKCNRILRRNIPCDSLVFVLKDDVASPLIYQHYKGATKTENMWWGEGCESLSSINSVIIIQYISITPLNSKVSPCNGFKKKGYRYVVKCYRALEIVKGGIFRERGSEQSLQEPLEECKVMQKAINVWLKENGYSNIDELFSSYGIEVPN